MNAATELCMETGSILEAHKLNIKVTHSICVAREDEACSADTLWSLSGKAFFIGEKNVTGAITNSDEELVFKSLKEIQP